MSSEDGALRGEKEAEVNGFRVLVFFLGFSFFGFMALGSRV